MRTRCVFSKANSKEDLRAVPIDSFVGHIVASSSIRRSDGKGNPSQGPEEQCPRSEVLFRRRGVKANVDGNTLQVTDVQKHGPQNH